MKKRSERRKHCALAVVRRAKNFARIKISPRCSPPYTESTLAVVRQSQNFRPAADPLPGGAGRPKFNQLEMVTTFTYRPSLVKIDARYFKLSMVTDPHTHKSQTQPQTKRQDRLQHIAPLSLAHSVIKHK